MLDALTGAKGRGKEGLTPEQEGQLNQAVGVLEAGVGAADPTTLLQLDGMWRLLYTSRPGTSSPIQRTFTGVDAFQIFQEVRGAHPECVWCDSRGAGTRVLTWQSRHSPRLSSPTPVRAARSAGGPDGAGAPREQRGQLWRRRGLSQGAVLGCAPHHGADGEEGTGRHATCGAHTCAR